MVKFIYERILIIKMGDKFVRIINSSEITNIVKDMCIEANIYLGNDVKNAIRAYEKEFFYSPIRCMCEYVMGW